MFTRNRAPQKRLAQEPHFFSYGTLERHTADLNCGRVRYLRHGAGTPLLLVHGVPTSARLWEPLLGHLGAHYDCIVPDLLGLGCSEPASDGTDFASPGQADMLAQLLDALGVDQCFAVFHDQGGAHGMEMLRRHGARIDKVVFTNCVCYDNWPVPLIDMSAVMARSGALPWLAKLRLMQWTLRLALPMTITRGPFPAALREDWFRALDVGGPALEYWQRYVTAQSARYTQEAVEVLRAWDKPAHVLWAADDRFLPPSWAAYLAKDLVGSEANPELLPFAGHFWQIEVPESGAAALHRFFSTAH